MFASVVCWATYSVASVPLLRKHSPLVVTGYSMAIGAGLYVACRVADAAASATGRRFLVFSWVLMMASAVFALALAYLIWYTSVQRAGSTRTAAWSNLTPVVATAIAALWLGEPVTAQPAGRVIGHFHRTVHHPPGLSRSSRRSS